MPIVLTRKALMQRATLTDGRLLHDRVLCGFCMRMNARQRTFRIVTSVAGKQFRMTLGYWPLMSVAQARQLVTEVLRECRAGRRPSGKVAVALPTLREALVSYYAAKGIKAFRKNRYDSVARTHFADWLDRSVGDLAGQDFSEHCHVFVQSKGAALVEVGRGLIAALMKYINAVHAQTLDPPFGRLAAAGLTPERSQPRIRMLQESDLPA